MTLDAQRRQWHKLRAWPTTTERLASVAASAQSGEAGVGRMRFVERLTGRVAVSVVAFGCGIGCGADELDPGREGDGGPSLETFGFDFTVYELDTNAAGTQGAPIPGALVAIELASGERCDLLTGNEGRVRIEVPADVDHFTWTVAAPGFLPVRTFYRVTVDEVQAQVDRVGELFTTMAPAPAPAQSPLVELRFNSTVPFCGSGNGDWACQQPDEMLPWHAIRASQPYLFVAYTLDDAGCPAQMQEVILPDTLTAQETELVFDGAPPFPLERVGVTLRLPYAPESLLRTGELLLTNHLPFWVSSPTHRIYGGACGPRHDAAAGTLDLTVAYFSKDGERLSFEAALVPVGASGWGADAAVSRRVLAGVPAPGVYDVMDLPVVSSPRSLPTRGSTFAWQEIAGATTFVLELRGPGAGDPTLWTTTSWRRQEIVLPSLPTGYDELAEWGGVADGSYRVWACEAWLPQHFASPSWVSSGASLVGWSCGYSAAMPGPILAP